MTGSVFSRPAKNLNSNNDGTSAHCRSSTTTSSGHERDARRTSEATESKKANRSRGSPPTERPSRPENARRRPTHRTRAVPPTGRTRLLPLPEDLHPRPKRWRPSTLPAPRPPHIESAAHRVLGHIGQHRRLAEPRLTHHQTEPPMTTQSPGPPSPATGVAHRPGPANRFHPPPHPSPRSVSGRDARWTTGGSPDPGSGTADRLRPQGMSPRTRAPVDQRIDTGVGKTNAHVYLRARIARTSSGLSPAQAWTAGTSSAQVVRFSSCLLTTRACRSPEAMPQPRPCAAGARMQVADSGGLGGCTKPADRAPLTRFAASTMSGDFAVGRARCTRMPPCGRS